MTSLELVFMGSGLKRKTGSFWYVIKVTPNLRGYPAEKKTFVCAF